MYRLNEIFYEDEEYSRRAEFCNKSGYMIEEIEPDEKGRRFKIMCLPAPTQEEINLFEIFNLRAKLSKIKEDIEQVQFGLIRDDYEAKKVLAAEIINEIRLLEGKEPRKLIN